MSSSSGTASGNAPGPADDGPPLETVAADPDALPRPEEEVADAGRDAPPPAADQPAAGGTSDGPAAQGDGAPDSY